MQRTTFVVIAVVATMLAMWGGAWVGLVIVIPEWEVRGQFGDMFGAVNALFSSLALVGVIVAIWVQKQELALQRQELEETRNELKRSAAAQEEAAKALEEQIKNQILASRLNGLTSMMNSLEAEISNVHALNQAETITSGSSVISIGNRPTKHLEIPRNSYRKRIRQLLIEMGQEIDESDGGWTEYIDDRKKK